ncbi:alpha/beta hydrolase [Consotaella aegiceratis]|uniref:alpha/beta hydrolase n=1 Tax=Consotaella aegiceratis TaxID=3097961 RepID=UPI002F3EBA83
MAVLPLGIGLSACSAGVTLLNVVTSRAGYEVLHDQPYAEGERGRYDLYVPDGADAATPMVVFLYGGSWDSGSKDIYAFLGQSLASAGIAVAIPDYRLYPEVVFPAFVEDGAAAVAAVAEAASAGEGLPAGDHPLFLMGHSAGAEIAALLAFDRRYLAREGLAQDRLAGFIGLAGPYDFLPLTEERYKRIFPEATRVASQPINFVDEKAPPMLLIAGDGDTTVDPGNTRRLGAKAAAVGASASVEILPGLSHIGVLRVLATALPFQNEQIRDSILRFIRERS